MDPRIPLDLTNRQYAHAATTYAALAVRLLNLETEQVWHAIYRPFFHNDNYTSVLAPGIGLCM